MKNILKLQQIRSAIQSSWGWFTTQTSALAVRQWRRLPQEWRNQAKRGGKIVLVVYGLLAILLSIAIYGLKAQNGVTYAASHIVPLPAAFVGAKSISYRAYMAEVRALAKHGKTNQEVSHQAMGELVTRTHLAALARRYEVTVTGQEVNAELDNYYDYYGGQQQAHEYYGGSKRRLVAAVKQDLLRSKLTVKISQDAALRELSRQKAESILAQARESKDLKELAAQYPGSIEPVGPEDPTVIDATKLPPEVQTAAAKIKDGEVGAQVIQADGAFYVVQRVRTEGEQLLVRVVAVEAYTLGQLLGEEYLKSVPLILLPQAKG